MSQFVRPGPRRFVGAMLAGLTLGLGVASAAAATTPPVNPPPAAAPVTSDHAQVIAQGVVELGNGDHHWVQSSQPLAAAVPLGPGGPTLVLTEDGSARVRLGGDVLGAQVDVGEATFVPAGVAATLSATIPTRVTLIGIAPGSGDDSFAPGAGLRDVELIRDVLGAGQTLDLTVGVSAVVRVTAGAISVGGGSVLAAGTERRGARGGADADERRTRPRGRGRRRHRRAGRRRHRDDRPTSDHGRQRNRHDHASYHRRRHHDSTTSTTTTTIDPTLDTDGDGLYDVDEIALGTDVNNADTDGDGFWDGHETSVTHTDPLNADSDSDGLNDYLEAHDFLTNANNPDTDGDGLTDGQEYHDYATDPLRADSDGDGFADGAEVAAGTDPLDSASHP